MRNKIRWRAGRKVGLSLPRRFVYDLLHFAKRVPSVPMQRRMALADVVEARAASDRRISWCAIFMKAYAIVTAARPELRQAFLSWPWPHLYEHPENVTSFSLERRFRDQDGVFLARIAQPERRSLAALDALVRYYKAAPLTEVDSYRHSLLLSRLPLLLRRLIWWLGLNTSGTARAYFFGTSAISVVASFGAASLHILSPLTTTLNYGTFEKDGTIDVRVTYDHRVLDGATMARAMVELEEVLHTQIRSELLELAKLRNRSLSPDRMIPAEFQEAEQSAVA